MLSVERHNTGRSLACQRTILPRTSQVLLLTYPEAPPERGRGARVDGELKVSGQLLYADDLALPGQQLRPRTVAAALGRADASRARQPDSPLAERLRAWRRERATEDGVPAYVVFNDRTLAALAERRPRSRGELLAVEGIGPGKLDRYGEALLRLLDGTGEP